MEKAPFIDMFKIWRVSSFFEGMISYSATALH